MQYFKQLIGEIERDSVLRYYGVAMALLHVLTAYWLVDFGASSIIKQTSEPICWPFFANCDVLRIFSELELTWIFVSYGVISLGVAILFLRARMVPAFLGLIAINVIKLVIVLIDYRLRLNQHYMGLAISMVYLFMPNKRVALPWMIMLFYFWAGVLKLNWGWISGDALLGLLPIFKGPLLKAACIYVLILEIIVVWGLIARRAMLFWSSFLQFVLFHIISWWVVSYFYPLLMFAILSIFVIERLLDDTRFGQTLTVPVGIMVVFFSMLQIVPYMFPGDHRITSEGRVFALNMFDAPHVCEVVAGLYTKDEECLAVDFRLPSAYRITCDPVVYYHRARNACRQQQWSNISITDLDLVINEGKNNNSLVHVPNFCQQSLEYHALTHNDWIRLY